MATRVLSSSELADVALDILFELVAHKIGRKTFRFWPPGVQVDPSSKQVPDSVLVYRCVLSLAVSWRCLLIRMARRTYTYLLDVVCPPSHTMVEYYTDRKSVV